MHVRKGDTVIVIAGNDKGKTGLVKEAIHPSDRVIVEGINLRWRHKKPSQQNPKGERVQRESPIHVSNVMLLDENTGKGVRRRADAESKSSKKPSKKSKKV